MDTPRILGVIGLLAIAGAAGAQQDVAILDRFATVGPYAIDQPQPSERGTTILYSRTTETGSRFNPGLGGPVGGPATQQNVTFDDVPIPNVRLAGNTSIAVSRVTVGIRRVANAPAVDVSLFWATCTTGPTPPDTELDVPFNSLGLISLPANGAAAVTQLVTIGDGSTTLFTTALNTTLFTDFSALMIGVQLSDANNGNGWRITSGPDANAQGVFWMYDTDNTNPEGSFSFGTGGPPSSFYIEIEGAPVPTPGALALLGLGGFAALRRRR